MIERHNYILKTIRDDDFDLKNPAPTTYRERRASRAVVLDHDGNVVLLHVTKKCFHKLPGGGVEDGEDVLNALKREVLEETGCTVTNIRELGACEEFRNKHQLHQISYCFLADLIGEKGMPQFTEDEITDGFGPIWMSIQDAIKTLEQETRIQDEHGKFVQVRDLTFLKEAQKHLVQV